MDDDAADGGTGPLTDGTSVDQGSGKHSGVGRRRFLTFAGVGTANMAFSIATAPRAGAVPTPVAPVTRIGTAADANAMSVVSAWAGALRTLFPYDGKVFYGYGDYDLNSGSRTNAGTNISFYDPGAGVFGTALTAFRTEQIMAYRKIEGRLYAANVDPSTGATGGGNCYATDDGVALGQPGAWGVPGGGAPVLHAYDVCGGLAPGERFLAGSTRSTSSGAVIWRSTNYGATWSEFFREPEAAGKVDGFERFYWLARIGTTLYCRANLGPQRRKVAPMRAYDMVRSRWSTVGDRKLALGGTVLYAGGWSGPLVLGDTQTTESSAVVVHGANAYFRSTSSIRAFNGSSMATVTGLQVTGIICLSEGEAGELYALAISSTDRMTTLFRIEGLVATPIVAFGSLGLTADGHAQLGALSCAVLGRTLYVGASEGSLFAVPLPA